VDRLLGLLHLPQPLWFDGPPSKSAGVTG